MIRCGGLSIREGEGKWWERGKEVLVIFGEREWNAGLDLLNNHYNEIM